LRHHDIRAAVDVCPCETKQTIASVQEQVLPPVVLNQPVAMVAAVVLENQPRTRVVKVRPADESSRVVIEIYLYVWSRHPGLHQEPAKTRLHWRLGRSRDQRKGAHLGHPGSTSGSVSDLIQSKEVRKTEMQRHIDCGQRLNLWPSETDSG